jgi:hypothetical protein
MERTLFLVGFLVAGFPVVEFLSAVDPESLGARASLVLFYIGGSVVSLTLFLFGVQRSRFRPGAVKAAFGGVASSIVFGGALCLMRVGLGFWASLGLAVPLAGLLALAWPFLAIGKVSQP